MSQTTVEELDVQLAEDGSYTTSTPEASEAPTARPANTGPGAGTGRRKSAVALLYRLLFCFDCPIPLFDCLRSLFDRLRLRLTRGFLRRTGAVALFRRLLLCFHRQRPLFECRRFLLNRLRLRNARRLL